jgi:AraC-like DNA-binding protein
LSQNNLNSEATMIYLHTATASLILFTIALLTGKKKNLPDYILIFWLVVLLSNMTAFFVLAAYSPPFNSLNSLLLEFSDSSTFLHGPIFWFYTLSLTKPDFRFKNSELLHLLPFIFVVILKSIVGLHTDTSLINMVKVIALLKFISLFIYAILVFLRVKKHQKKVKHIFSNLENKHLDWLKFLSLGIIALWFIGLLSNITDWLKFSHSYDYDGLLFQLSADSFIIAMTYFGFLQKGVYDKLSKTTGKNEEKYLPNSLTDENTEVNKTQSIKYQKSGLSEMQSKEIHAELMNLMEDNKIYKNDDLTLFSLASMLKVSPNHLSQIINSIEERSFFDFINFHRIEEVKNCITQKEKEHLTILGIAYECGFSSKAAFHRAFKKFTGVTPTEYKRTSTR